MKIPVRFLKFSQSHDGVDSQEGWLEIDIRALDLDGVTKLHINLADVASVKGKRDRAAAALDTWDARFGKKEE